TIDGGAPGEGLDPFARLLLPRPVRALVDGIDRASRVSPAVLRAARFVSIGLIDHCELRSLAIDAVARAALEGGVSQLVILGAGLDARAWRLPEASRARTFEVDHPATQRYKRLRLGDGGDRGGRADVTFVSVDFERDSLGARLDEAGHDVRDSTLWIWEGVTPYLVREATASTLRIVGDRSAKGSTL